MEVAWSGARSIEVESIAAVREEIRQYRGHKYTQCYKCLGYGPMSYQCTQRIRRINCRKEGHKAADCFQLDNDAKEEVKERS